MGNPPPPPPHYGYNDIVALLLERGARQKSKASHLEIKDRHGYTPLLKAAKDGNEDVVKLLLNRGAQIEASAKDGMTALHWASYNGHDVTVKLLLDRGAQIEASARKTARQLLH